MAHVFCCYVIARKIYYRLEFFVVKEVWRFCECEFSQFCFYGYGKFRLFCVTYFFLFIDYFYIGCAFFIDYCFEQYCTLKGVGHFGRRDQVDRPCWICEVGAEQFGFYKVLDIYSQILGYLPEYRV